MKIHKAPISLLLLLLPSRGLSSTAREGLSDPVLQPKFTTIVPNPLDPSFVYDTTSGKIEISVNEGTSNTGLVGPDGVTEIPTPIWGYGTPELGYTWPGRTFVVKENELLSVTWQNKLPIAPGYLLTGMGEYDGRSVVDESFHWAYSLHGYEDYSIEEHGTPISPHVHGGHSDPAFDGNPEYFFSPEFGVKGPQWVHEAYEYDNSQPAGLLWYHDHALGMTRTNVYAGLAGFYVVRDDTDTGKEDNPTNLPAFPYEIPLVVQDKMFKETGELFYPAFKGDPYYKDFITDENAQVADDDPTALAEFFGDHMVVNGKIWPKLDVEPRKYRLRLLNGCDSRFLVIQFWAVQTGQDENYEWVMPVEFTVIGGDQGLAAKPTTVETLVVEPASRWDIIIDFSNLLGQRIVMKNIGGDEPFGGDIPGPQLFDDTDKIMAFDVFKSLDMGVPDDFDIDASSTVLSDELVAPDNTRRVGLFEGHDQFGRLQPLLGTVDKATDMNGDPINYPNTDEFKKAGLTGQMEGTMPWHYPITENIKLGAVEEWEIWNLSADAHPMHLHLVHFQLVSRKAIIFDGFATEEGEIEPGDAAAGNGTFTADMPLLQHDGSMGEGYRVVNPTSGDVIPDSNLTEYIHNFPMDTIVALPGQVTTIRATFDKPGRYNWHCHILAHEDHEMMRIFHVGPLPDDVIVHNASSSMMANVRGWTALVGGLLLLVFV